MTFNPNPSVIMGLYDRFGPFNSAASLSAAALTLTSALRISMTQTDLYGIPLDQALPAEHPTDAVGMLVHPHNIASALIAISSAHAQLGGALPIDPALSLYQLHEPAGWVSVADVAPAFPVAQVTVQVPPPAPVIPAAPSIAPAPIAPAPADIAPAPQVDISALVDAAMSSAPITPQVDPATLAAPQTVAATPVQPDPVVAEPVAAAPAHAPQTPAPAVIDHATGQPDLSSLAQAAAPPPLLTPAQVKGPALEERGIVLPDLPGDPARALQHAASLATAQGVPGPAVVTHAEAVAESIGASVLPDGLPDPSVLLGRSNPKTGRDMKSPFDRKVELRSKIAANPWWWDFFAYSAPRLFVDNPAAALDPESTGAGPVQAYAALVELFLSALDGADGEVSVAQLRAFLREVQSGYNALPDAAAINQLADHMFRGSK